MPPGPAEDGLGRAAAESFQFVWRCLRRLGVGNGPAVDDAAQRVFEIAARKRDRIEPGRERAFLYKPAILVGAESRRATRRAREIVDSAATERARDGAPDPEQLAVLHARRALLDDVLDSMSAELREVFVLFELEELPMSEIAVLIEIPAGTVASRLRRAREEFHAAARRVRARLDHAGGRP